LGFSLDEVASEAGWSKQRLNELEASDDADAAEAQVLTDLYGIDVDELLDDGPEEAQMPASALLRARHDDVSADTRFAITNAASVARDARRLQRMLGRETGWDRIEAFRHRPEDDDPGVAEELARQVRERLDLGAGEAIGSVSKLIEKMGILLIWTELDREVDAVSMATSELGGVIVANGAGTHMQTGCHRRVTLAHELCHILFDRPRMNGLDRFCVTGGIDENAAHRDNIERRARAFPAYLLAPRAAVERIWRSTATLEDKVAAVMDTFGLGYEATRHHLHFLRVLPLDRELEVSADPSRWDAADPIPDLSRDTVQRVALQAGIDPMRVQVLLPLVTTRDGVSDTVAREMLRANPKQWDEIRLAAFGQSMREWATPSSAIGDDAAAGD
jgi:Zn-dependent peptidase ImmA (M78 family)